MAQNTLRPAELWRFATWADRYGLAEFDGIYGAQFLDAGEDVAEETETRQEVIERWARFGLRGALSSKILQAYRTHERKTGNASVFEANAL